MLQDIDPEKRSSILYGTVAVYLAFAEEWLEMETLSVSVTDDGKTLIDPNGQSMRCATGWRDYPAFMDFLTSRLV